MSKKEFSHGSARGGYGSEQGIPLAMVSDQALVDEINRRGFKIDGMGMYKLVLRPNKRLGVDFK